MNEPDRYPCGTPRPRNHASPTHTSPPASPRHLPLLLWVLGLLSLGWLLLRSGFKPSRISYPCQTMASQVVGVAFGAAALRWLRPRVGAARTSRLLLGVASAALALVFFSDQPPSIARGVASADYRAQIYVVHDVGGPAGEHHAGFDALVGCMDANGLPLYKSATVAPGAGPNGVVGPHDVVLIKVNQQWDERGGTNTDLLKGIIARLLEHPDGFDGEIVVMENTQLYGTLDWANSNAEDHSQSVVDVVQHFATQGRPVSSFFLDTIRSRSVAEYSAGDMQDGYVVGAYDAGTQMRVSYPKFRTAGGRYVSLKQGVWSGGSYSDASFIFLSVPVLKCHGAVYGVTGATKHHMGSMTTGLSTSAHNGVRYGGLGRFLADVRRPDLNILDCIYILARPSYGPSCGYADATRANKLVAGVDPIAIDMWATTNILVPTILANGYTTYPKQDPTNPASIFRTYLDAAMNVMLSAGIDVTNDLSKIDAFERSAVDVETEPTGSSGLEADPNPSSQGCRIRFSLAQCASVRLELFDANGRAVRVIEQTLSGGVMREIAWDGLDGAGREVPRGIYAYRVVRPEGVVTGRVAHL